MSEKRDNGGSWKKQTVDNQWPFENLRVATRHETDANRIRHIFKAEYQEGEA